MSISQSRMTTFHKRGVRASSFIELPSGIAQGYVPESTVNNTDDDSELSHREIYILYFSLRGVVIHQLLQLL